MDTLHRWLDRLGFVGLSGGVLLSGYLQGFYALSLRVEVAFGVLAVALLQATLSSLMFSAFILVSGGLLLYHLRCGEEIVDPPTTGGTVTAIVPAYGDADVLHTSVESLLDANYEDLDVVIVHEQNDEPTRKRAEEFAEAYDRVRCLVNTRYPGSKAGAINYAAEVTESAFLAVFDADECVDPDFVPQAVARLAEHDVVQGRTVPQPTGLIESIAYYESILLSYAARRLLYVFTSFRMAASRAVVMRREAFEVVDGYDTTMLTEDFDFAYRCYRERLDVVEHMKHPSRIDAAHTVRDWWGQRKRWMTGYAQVSHKLATSVKPTDHRSVLSALICAGTVAGPPLMLSIISKFGVLFVVSAKEVVLVSLSSGAAMYYEIPSNGVFLVPLTALFVVTLSVHLHDYHSDAIDGLDWHWILVPILFPLYSLVAIKAVFEYLLSWSGEWYTVEKNAEKV